MELDLRTTSYISAAVYSGLTLMLYAFWLQHKDIKGLAEWCTFMFLLAVRYSFHATLDYPISDTEALFINASTVCALTALTVGYYRHFELKLDINAVAVFLSAYFLVSFTLFYLNVEAEIRILVNTSFDVFILGVAAYGLKSINELEKNVEQKLNLFFVIAIFFAYFTRGIIVLIDETGALSALLPFTIVVIFTATILATLGLIMLILAEQRHKLLEVRFTDQLTGLFSRQGIFERTDPTLRHTLRTSDQLACGVIDIDDFSQCNNHLGHDGGNKVLVSVAETLKACISKKDSLARLGGDEFLVILADADEDEAELAFNRIQERISNIKYTATDNTTHALMTNIGVSLSQRDEPGRLEPMIQRALTALDAAKNDPENSLYFSD